MTLIAVKEFTSAADMMASHAATRARLLGQKQPAKKPEPEVVYQIVRAPAVAADLNAHVLDWYKAKCERMGKRVSELEMILGASEGEDGRRVYACDIIAKMSHHYGFSVPVIKSDRRNREIVLARQKMMWVVKMQTVLSFPAIGRQFGGKDHTTVLHAFNKIDRLIAVNDPRVADLKEWVSQ